MDPSLMDELFERIRLLEEESKVLEKENNDLDKELLLKKSEDLTKKWITDKEKEENEKKIDSYIEKVNNYKKLLNQNFSFPSNSDEASPAKLKNKKFNEIEILNFFKLLNEEKKRLISEKQKTLENVEKKINLSKELDPRFNELINQFEKNFKGRIIYHKNIRYLIHSFDRSRKNMKVIRLYDSNGIKVDSKAHERTRIFNTIELKDLFDNCYILSKEESNIIIKDYANDNKNYIKIYFQTQISKANKYEKDLIPYKIEPNYIDINQYNLEVQGNSIRFVQNKENACFVTFDSISIGDGKSTTGLVSSSLIKIYTTLYSKDIVNILHMHLNDTSKDITIDSEFLEKKDNILNHKVFTVDASGKRLTYKLIFKDYRLIKVYYSVSNDFIDEPPFQEIRLNPNHFVKIINGDYKNYYGQVKDFPIGMLARKDKGAEEIKRMISSGFKKEGYCSDRHLQELPGFISVEILFEGNSSNPVQLKEPIDVDIPVCFLQPLSPEEQIKFEKNVIIQQEMEIEEANKEIDEIFSKFQDYEGYAKNDSLLEEKTMDEIRGILDDIENVNIEDLEQNSSDENRDKIEFIKEIKNKIQPVLMQKIRYFKLMGKK